jgi:hypothetical protein
LLTNITFYMLFVHNYQSADNMHVVNFIWSDIENYFTLELSHKLK